jgi:hypothetical protein
MVCARVHTHESAAIPVRITNLLVYYISHASFLRPRPPIWTLLPLLSDITVAAVVAIAQSAGLYYIQCGGVHDPDEPYDARGASGAAEDMVPLKAPVQGQP